jgi:hypothetical protein
VSELETIRAGYEQILEGAGAYYEALVRELGDPAVGEPRRAELTRVLDGVTQLIEVLESVVHDGMRRLEQPGVA